MVSLQPSHAERSWQRERARARRMSISYMCFASYFSRSYIITGNMHTTRPHGTGQATSRSFALPSRCSSSASSLRAFAMRSASGTTSRSTCLVRISAARSSAATAPCAKCCATSVLAAPGGIRAKRLATPSLMITMSCSSRTYEDYCDSTMSVPRCAGRVEN